MLSARAKSVTSVALDDDPDSHLLDDDDYRCITIGFT